jgi:hypothetical protein
MVLHMLTIWCYFHFFRRSSQIKGQAFMPALREQYIFQVTQEMVPERRRKASIIAQPPSPNNATLAGSGTAVMTV